MAPNVPATGESGTSRVARRPRSGRSRQWSCYVTFSATAHTCFDPGAVPLGVHSDAVMNDLPQPFLSEHPALIYLTMLVEYVGALEIFGDDADQFELELVLKTGPPLSPLGHMMFSSTARYSQGDSSRS